MADIRAFRAYRYDLGRVGALSEVIAPPYDVIDAELQQELYARSPYNVIRLILNKEEPADTETNNRYTRSARFLPVGRKTPVCTRAARARSSAGASGRLDATATTSTPSRRWTVSSSAWRLVPSPETITATR